MRISFAATLVLAVFPALPRPIRRISSSSWPMIKQMRSVWQIRSEKISERQADSVGGVNRRKLPISSIVSSESSVLLLHVIGVEQFLVAKVEPAVGDDRRSPDLAGGLAPRREFRQLESSGF